MSTENNPDKIYKDSIRILTDLIAFKTISGNDNNSLINSLRKRSITSQSRQALSK